MRRHPKELQTKVRLHRVAKVHEQAVEVTSGSTGEVHFVNWADPDEGLHCDCDFHFHRGLVCSHILKAVEAGVPGYRLSLWATEEDARRQHSKLAEVEDGLYATFRKVSA